MSNIAVQAIMVLALPLAVFLNGAWIMSKASGRDYVTQRLQRIKNR